MKIVKGGKKNADQNDHNIYKEAFLRLLMQFRIKSESVTENFHVGIIAWNMANIKMQNIPGFDFLMESTKSETGLTKKEWNLLKQMVDYKVAQFGHLTLFIKDIQNENDEKNFTLEIIDMEQFIKEGPPQNDDDYDDFYEEDEDDDDEPSLEQEGIIDRDAIIVSMTEEFKNLTGFDKKKSIYLIPEFFTFEHDYKAWLKANYKDIFEMEILNIAEQYRPKKLTFSLFEKWFEVERIELPYDMVSEPVYKE